MERLVRFYRRHACFTKSKNIYSCGSGTPAPSCATVKIRILIFALAALAGLLPASRAESGPNPKQTLVDKALRDFEAKKFDEALTNLQEAEKLDPDSAFVLNLIGAAYTKKKDYPAAKSYFDKALSSDSGFFPAMFNCGELLFLQKKYSQALEYFTRMLSNDPGHELLQFKVVLCLILTNQMEDAQKLASRIKFPGDGPAWYFVQAALKLQEGNKRKAVALITNAQTLFPGRTSLFEETFIDLGWPVK